MSEISDDVPASERTVLMVLADGRTYGGLDGCRIVTVPDEWSNDEIVAALRGEDEDGLITHHDVHQITMFNARPGS
jgi:hypothetical protein